MGLTVPLGRGSESLFILYLNHAVASQDLPQKELLETCDQTCMVVPWNAFFSKATLYLKNVQVFLEM